MLDAIFQVIDENREVCIRELQALCRQPSIGVSGEGHPAAYLYISAVGGNTSVRKSQAPRKHQEPSSLYQDQHPLGVISQ
jgi:hypothetical protein